MKHKHVLFLFSLLCFVRVQAQLLQPANALLRQRLIKYAADNHLPPGGMYMYWDSAGKKPVRFQAGSFLTEDASAPQQTATEEVKTSQPSGSNSLTGSGSNFHLVQDIHTATDANPALYSYSTYNPRPQYAVLNNVAYFSADDGVHGTELWRSDGTAAGTYLFRDINPGTASSTPYNLYASGGRLYFSVAVNTGGILYWQAMVSDGTSAPPVSLLPSNVSVTGAPGNYCAANGTVFFSTGTYFDLKIWKTNGTAAGTTVIKDYSGTNITSFRNFTAQGSLLYFTAGSFFGDGSVTGLYRSDGTANGTYLIHQGSSWLLTPYNGFLYFIAYNGSTPQLWLSLDGTVAGTGLATTQNGVSLSDYSSYDYIASSQMVVSQNALYFPGYTNTTGWELYKYDAGSGTGTTLVKDIAPGNGTTYSSISDFGIAELNGTVYFLYYNSFTSRYSLYKTNGTDAGTVPVKEFDAGYYPVINSLYTAGNKLYTSFGSATSRNGEVWVSDGTPAGTAQLADIYPGTGSFPNYFTACNGKVLFGAKDKQHGAELFFDAGSTAQLVKDINTTTTASSYLTDMTAFKNGVITNAYTYETGYEPYTATTASASIIKDEVPAAGSSNPRYFTVQGDAAYFAAYTDVNGLSLQNIFITDGTAANTTKLIADISGGDIRGIAVTGNGLVYYAYYNYSAGAVQVWRTDGTAAGTLLLGSYNNINSFYNYSTQRSSVFTVLGNTVYFVAVTSNTGAELYRTDGTAQNTLLITDINPGSAGSNPSNLTVFNGNVYFSAYDGSENGLWRTDGNSTGKIAGGYYVTGMAASGNALYFSVAYSISGNGLWKTDGTTAGTVLINGVTSPSYLTDVNGSLYFVSYDASNYAQLWKSDGTGAGTQQLSSFTTYSNLNSLTAADGSLFFSASNRLWVSDGTAAGTKAVDDPFLNNLSVYGLLANGSTLFVNGYTYQYGQELYAGDVSGIALPVHLLSFNASLQGNDVITQWQTASEINASYFNVQRSTDGIQFTNAGKVMAKGSGSAYSFPDVNIASLVSGKTVYYRLQMVDKDGSTSYSEVIPVELKWKDAIVLLLPNPVKDVLKIKVNNYTGKAAVGVFDVNGKKVYATQQMMQGSGDIAINASALQSGVYMVTISLDGKMIRQKFMKE